MPEEEGSEVFSAKQSRQGFKGKPVLTVLISSLILVSIVWFGVEWWGRSTSPDTPAATSGQTTPNPGGQGAGTFDNNPPSGSAPATEGTDRSPTR